MVIGKNVTGLLKRGPVTRKEVVAFLGRYGFMIALLLPAIFLFITNETFRNPMNLSNILAQSSMVGVAAVGMTVVMILGGFDLSIGAELYKKRLNVDNINVIQFVSSNRYYLKHIIKIDVYLVIQIQY